MSETMVERAPWLFLDRFTPSSAGAISALVEPVYNAATTNAERIKIRTRARAAFVDLKAGDRDGMLAHLGAIGIRRDEEGAA